MDVYKAYQISGDYKGLRRSPDWQSLQFAEIVFVDRTHHGSKPLVYQLKDSYLPLEKTIDFCRMHPSEFGRDGFILLGYEEESDRKKKQIVLDNKMSVSYTHLVVVSGTKPLLSFEHEELLAAFQALNDALRVKPKIPSSFAANTGSGSPYTSASHQDFQVHGVEQAPKSSIRKGFQPNISSAMPKGITFELNTLNKRCYEVQL